MKNIKVIPVGRQGFTLIEIIVTMSIIAFLTASMFQVIATSETQQGLIINGERTKSALRMAQGYSLSVPQESTQRYICGFGINSSGSTSILYFLYISDYINNPEACDNANDYTPTSGAGLIKIDKETFVLDAGYVFSGSSDIFFKAPYGEVYDNSTLLTTSTNIVVENPEGSTKNIIINRSGQIVF